MSYMLPQGTHFQGLMGSPIFLLGHCNPMLLLLGILGVITYACGRKSVVFQPFLSGRQHCMPEQCSGVSISSEIS